MASLIARNSLVASVSIVVSFHFKRCAYFRRYVTRLLNRLPDKWPRFHIGNVRTVPCHKVIHATHRRCRYVDGVVITRPRHCRCRKQLLCEIVHSLVNRQYAQFAYNRQPPPGSFWVSVRDFLFNQVRREQVKSIHGTAPPSMRGNLRSRINWIVRRTRRQVADDARLDIDFFLFDHPTLLSPCLVQTMRPL